MLIRCRCGWLSSQSGGFDQVGRDFGGVGNDRALLQDFPDQPRQRLVGGDENHGGNWGWKRRRHVQDSQFGEHLFAEAEAEADEKSLMM